MNPSQCGSSGSTGGFRSLSRSSPQSSCVAMEVSDNSEQVTVKSDASCDGKTSKNCFLASVAKFKVKNGGPNIIKLNAPGKFRYVPGGLTPRQRPSRNANFSLSCEIEANKMKIGSCYGGLRERVSRPSCEIEAKKVKVGSSYGDLRERVGGAKKMKSNDLRERLRATTKGGDHVPVAPPLLAPPILAPPKKVYCSFTGT